MKKNIFAFLLMLAVLFTAMPQKTQAEQKASASSATIKTSESKTGVDYREKVLREYLQKQNSPLTPYAGDFIKYADQYNLDWKLVAAISGVESTFGQQIPANSYNGWGWGVYGDNVIRFSSWNDGIKTVSEGLRQRYMNQWGAQDIYEIGSIYAASPAWASHVTYYLNRIQEFALADTKDTLSLSL